MNHSTNGRPERLDDLARPEVKLSGRDGNAFAILGGARRAARKAGWTDDDWEAFREWATSGGSYDALLQRVQEVFEVK